MNRRSYLAALGTSVVLTGCVTAPRERPTVARGETATVVVELSDVGSLSVRLPVGTGNGGQRRDDGEHADDRPPASSPCEARRAV